MGGGGGYKVRLGVVVGDKLGGLHEAKRRSCEGELPSQNVIVSDILQGQQLGEEGGELIDALLPMLLLSAFATHSHQEEYFLFECCVSFVIAAAGSESIDREQAMERRDFDYYEARARDVKFEDITSCKGNASILQELRRQCTSLYDISITDDDWGNFVIGEGDDLGWLGYFIGKSKCVNELTIYSSGEGQNTEAFIDGINRNQSIISLTICTDLGGS
eukprot:scaffold19582_cov76-Skeletonema_dohrnii-CCMP3373.AAC.1